MDLKGGVALMIDVHQDGATTAAAGTAPTGEAGSPTLRSLPALIELCQRWRIAYRETTNFTNLRGVVVTSGSTSCIAISQRLSEPEKLDTLAHELAHVALGHTAGPATLSLTGERPSRKQREQLRKQDHEASMWAAHLLVSPALYDMHLHEARGSNPDERMAVEVAIARTAVQLNILTRTVALWLETRDHAFSVAPHVWLEQH